MIASTQLWWYAARSGGIVAWAALSASVVWGLMLSGKVRPGRVRPNWMLDLHRYLGALATVFTAIHVLTIVADSYTSFGPADVLVPFASSWRPGAVAWGIVGMYFLAAVELTSLAKRRLPNKLWKRTHFLSYPLWFTATVHLLTAGTERTNPVLLVTVAALTLVIAALTLWRIAVSARRGRDPRRGTTTRDTGPTRRPQQAAAPQPSTPQPSTPQPPTPQWAPPLSTHPPVGYPTAPPAYRPGVPPPYLPQ